MTDLVQARIEKVARALCRADGHEEDDEDWIVANPTTFGLGDVVVGGSRGPKWLQYRSTAKRFIAAYDAISEDSA